MVARRWERRASMGLSKIERRERLRKRIPQAEEVESDSESDSEFEEDGDDIDSGDESDDGSEVEQPGRVNPPEANPPAVEPPAAQPSAPGFVTLVPSPNEPTQIPGQPPSPTRIVQPAEPPASQPVEPPQSQIEGPPRSTLIPAPAEPSESSEPSRTDEPSRTRVPAESVVRSATEVEPTTFFSSTITNGPNNPTATSGVPDDEDAESLISDTSLLASSTTEPTSIPSEEVEQVGATDGGSNSRGTDVGIIVGTMALATLLIAACVLFYRRQKKARQDHLTRLDEKVSPPTPDGLDTGDNQTRFNSWAIFTRPNREDPAAASYYGADNKGGHPASPLSPSRPPTAHGAAGAFRMLTGGQEPPPQMTSRYDGRPVEGRLVPPPTHLAPPPRTDIYPPR